MSNFPDFSELGYQVERELGQNRAGGRVTYLATNTNTQLPVVIKQFQFAQSGASWSEYDAYQREIQVLQQLNHPNIPRYLDAFETPTGFCLVQEYKKAPSLTQPRYWSPSEIKQIAVAVLKILMYLQKQVPPAIHRDIKPENILVDRQGELKVYLVDFGFAHMGSGEVAVSSVVKGTLGFMPPEQLFNRQLTEASDLYSLGATLICLLTQTKSTAIGNLIDAAYRINFKHLVPKLNPQFIDWLEQMVAPNVKNRYPNAEVALSALMPIDVVSQTTTLGMLVHAMKLNLRATAIGLVGLVALFSINFIISRISISSVDDPVRRLLVTKQCQGCDLSGVNLQRANLAGAKLENAILVGVFLRDAFLGGANLEGAYLRNADLARANLRSANLEGASLTEAELLYADLGRANLERANLRDAKLWRTNLTGANLERVILINAYLGGANLTGVNLTGANLTGANLVKANLENANLEGAELKSTQLYNANLTGANLYGVNLTYVELTKVNLQGARMPDGSIHPLNYRKFCRPRC